MSKQLPLAQIFEYDRNAINLIGFPHSEILSGLKRFFGLETLLKRHQRSSFGRRIANPSLTLRHIEERQEFFKRLESSHGIKKAFFDKGFPKLDGNHSSEEFLKFCDRIYEVLKTAKTELKDFDYLPETKRIISRANQFDSKLEAMLETLDSIEKMRTFVIDSQEGAIAGIPEMPSENRTKFALGEQSLKYEWKEYMFKKIRLKMKEQAMEIAKEVGVDFKGGIIDYFRREFKFGSRAENFRRDFEQLALPIRLHSFYGKFLDSCKQYQKDWEEDGSFSEMPDPGYPNFDKHYDIRGLFPPELMSNYRIHDSFVPIDFHASSSERKFLIAGLHSGGKSFFLENLILTSVIGQLGLTIPADSLTLPKYDRIYYYRNVENDGWGGKLETELEEINNIIYQAEAGDLVVIDEFLDSTSAEIANSLGPAILDKLMKSESTVFVTSHRSTNYNQLSENGWTLMSPDYNLEEGRVKPKLTLTRGPPDPRINERYILEKYSEIFDVGKK